MSEETDDGWKRGFPAESGMYHVLLNDGEQIITRWNNGGGVSIRLEGPRVCMALSSGDSKRIREGVGDTWGRTFRRYLARGYDHGWAAYRADEAEQRAARRVMTGVVRGMPSAWRER